MNRLLLHALVIFAAAAAWAADAGASGFPPLFNVSLLNGKNGFKIVGIAVSGTDGRKLAIADVNGDGFADVIILGGGSVYTVFGKHSGFPTSIDVSSLDGSNGFKLIDTSHSGDIGYVASRIGDVNGDGIDDIAVGGWGYYNGTGIYSGRVRVLFGSRQAFPAQIDLASLDGKKGFTVGDASGLGLGWDVAAAGDINGDGISDLAAGGGFSNGLAIGVVVYGRKKPFSATLDIATLTAKQRTIVITPWGGVTDEQNARLQAAGDINHDGIADLAVSNPYTTANGKASIIFGSMSGLPRQLWTSHLTGANGYSLLGDSTKHERLGYWIGGLGDINGDGIDDWTTSGSGDKIVFGHAPPFDATLPDISLNGSNGFRVDHLGDLLGIGDVNGDGVADFAGSWAHYSSTASYGYVEVIYGSKAPQPAVVDAAALDATAASRIRGLSSSCCKLAAGDVNGDGVPDLVIADPDTFSGGGINVVFGRK